MKKVLKFVKGGSKDKTDPRGSKESVNQLATSSSNDSLNNNGYHIDIYGADKTMNKLHKSAYQGNMDKLKLALKVTDIDTVDELSRTALHFAIAQRHTNIVWHLLSNKARMDMLDRDGFTPFHKAVQCGNMDCTHLMLERGAEIDSTDENGNTALHLATRQGYFNIVALLLKKGADLSIFNNQGEVPLHIATIGEHKELVNLLLKYGATVNVPDRLQRTPLMLAARVGNIQLIHVFLQHGAHLDCCDSNGWTASDYALIGSHQEIAKQLAQIPRAKTSLSSEKLDMLDTIGEDSELSDVDNSLEPHINININNNNNNELNSCSIVKREMSVHDSPLSCITPPPLKPPRSWDLIQSGMIDTQESIANNNVQKRKSLTTLGSLESRRESFVENNNTSINVLPEENTSNNLQNHSVLGAKLSTCENKLESDIEEKQLREGGGEMKSDEMQNKNLSSVCDENQSYHIKESTDRENESESSSNSSSLLNELANNILVSQINKIALEEQLGGHVFDDDVDSPCTSAKSLETMVSKTNDDSEPQTPALAKSSVIPVEIASDVVKRGRSFFESKSNSNEKSNSSMKSSKSIDSSDFTKKDVQRTTAIEMLRNGFEVHTQKTNEQIELVARERIGKMTSKWEMTSNEKITQNTSEQIELVSKDPEELTLEDENLASFNSERDEEIQAIIMQANLKDQQLFLTEKMDISFNKMDFSIENGGIESKDSIELEDSTCDTVIDVKKIETANSVETSDSSTNKSDIDDDNSFLNEINALLEHNANSNTTIVTEQNTNSNKTLDNDSIALASAVRTCEINANVTAVTETSNVLGLASDTAIDMVARDTSSTSPLIQNINTDNPSVSNTKAVHEYLASTNFDIPSTLPPKAHDHGNSINEKPDDAVVCNSCVGSEAQSCDLMNKSCDYLINNIDQVLQHINSNTSDIVQQNQLLETHLSLKPLQPVGNQTDAQLNDGLDSQNNTHIKQTDEIDTKYPDVNHAKEENEDSASEMDSEAEDLSDDETLADLQDETLLQHAMKHLPRHKSLDLSDDSMPYIASPKVKDAPGPTVHLFDELPPPPSEFSSSFLDDQASSASLVSLDNLPLPPEEMLEEEEEGNVVGEKQLACIEEEETVSEMSNCREIPYRNMEDCSLDEDSEADGNKTPTNEDPTPLDFDTQEPSYIYSNEGGINGDDKDLHISCSEISAPIDYTPHHSISSADKDYQVHSMLDENTLFVEVNMNSSENGSDPRSSDFNSYRDYVYTLSEQSDGSRIKDQLACYDRAIEELNHAHICVPNGAKPDAAPGRAYGESDIHSLIDQDLKDLTEKLSSENHEVYASGDSSVPDHLQRLLSTEDKKRKLLVSMTNIDLADEEDKEEDGDTEEDPPFWSSEEGGRGGRFACLRQNTVIYNEEKSDDSPHQEEIYHGDDSMSTTSSSGLSDNPKHVNLIKSTSSILRETTLERSRLEEAVGVLRSRVEVLEYQLADATQSLALRCDTVSALEESVAKHEATISHHLQLVNTLSYQNQNYQSEINHLTSLYTKDESADRIVQLESSLHNLMKKIDNLNAQINSLSEENIVLHEFIANIDSEESKNLNIPASFKLMKKQNMDHQNQQGQGSSNMNQIPREIYDDIISLKRNLEKEVMLRKQVEEKYSIQLGKKLQEMEMKHAEELKKQEQVLKKEKVLKIDAELRHKKELDLERQILVHEISRLKNEIKNKDMHVVKLEAQLKAKEVDKSTVRKQLIDSVNREIG